MAASGVTSGHRARAARRWGDAHAAFARARDDGEQLDADDLVAFGDAAWWLGHTDESIELTVQAHDGLVREGRRDEAAMCALQAGFLLLLRGDLALGSGWIARAHRASDDLPAAATVHGYLRWLQAQEALEGARLDTALDEARAAAQHAVERDDVTLLTLARVVEGVARVRAGDLAAGMAELDEAMLPVFAGEVSPDWAGNVYCQMMALCHELGDVRRMRAWTDTTERWCAGFDHAVMFTGICRMHRVQLLQLCGDWQAASEQADRVCVELADSNPSVVAEGHYLRAELLRLRGRTAESEAAYRDAHGLGRDPQPGLALLRLQQGRPDLAAASLATTLAATAEQGRRARLRRAQVEVAVVGGDLELAQAAVDELVEVATTLGTDAMTASAVEARGRLLLAEGRPADALPDLDRAVRIWRELDAPHDRARAQVVVGRCREALGDEDAATLAFDAARATFAELGATVDLDAIDRDRGHAPPPGGLTPREAEVLGLVATGRTNREVADTLVISDRTVARHLANVHRKLGVGTRTAAAAWARDHGLAPPA